MVAWSEIEAECGNYRDGFIAVFRKYEGQPTDEKDAQGRTVKVTAASFARHMGIPESTFKDWTKTTARVVLPEQRASMDASRAKKVLAEAPLEQVEQILSGLPKDRVQAIGAAAGNEYLKARQEYEDEEQRRSPAEQQEIRAARESITEAGRRATAGFTSLGIAGHIEQATDELRELVADGSVTPAAIELIERALRGFIEEYQVARAMAGLESDMESLAR